MFDSQCDFNSQLQGPVYPVSPPLPMQGCCLLPADTTGECSSLSEENGNLSWLPYSEGAEKSLDEEQARLPRPSPTNTKKKKEKK